MAHGNLREFNPKKESIEDFHERFEFYCVANGISGDNADKKKAMFITLLGQETFARLKILASPTNISELPLDAIMQHLTQHFRPTTIEIAERFKFFKRQQNEQESAMEYMSELRGLAKTCNFAAYLETALRDQFVCGLGDVKCQRELLCEADLTADTALKKARAAEVVLKETQSMQACKQESESYPVIHATSSSKPTKPVCFRCGQQGHAAPDCRFKSAKCFACQKIGHLARVCQARHKLDTKKALRQGSSKNQEVHQLHNRGDDSSGSSTEEYLHSVFQLGNTSPKFIITVVINGVHVDMEADSGAERSTIPWRIFQDKLANVCKLVPSSVKLHQYDQSPLTVKGECKVKVRVNECVIDATFVVVDVLTCYPLFGRDWMLLLGFDLPILIKEATQVHNMYNGTGFSSPEQLFMEYSEVFKDQLGVLRGIEAAVSVHPQATPKFHRPRPVPFAIKEKLEETLTAQVEGELIPIERSEWAAPIVVVHKRDGGLRVCGDFKVTINPVICPQVYPLPTPEEMFSTLANGESYSKLDLSRAYKQMKVTKSSQPLLTINTHLGLFQYARLPFGIPTAPALWQKAMAQVLQGIPGVVYFIDDILVTGHTRLEHEANLRRVLDRIREYGLRLKKSKCLFFSKRAGIFRPLDF